MTFIKIPYSESAYSITPYSQWKQVNAIILRFVNKISKWFALICLPIFVNNNNKYSYYKFVNAKFVFSILVYLI